ncbi:hypothetical protein EU527_09660 [Candidatus Thorarchaeota archaeon]|nr:MAG: hypothetical protein EU527_09660 [Candidatus Thorarchaeota archaeon]
MDSTARIIQLIDIWQKIIGPDLGWAFFENGTCVVSRESGNDVKMHAIETLREWGPVVPGTPLGDFDFELYNNPSGLLVRYYNPDVLSFLMEDEFDRNNPLEGALKARYRRGLDSETLRVLHIQGINHRG